MKSFYLFLALLIAVTAYGNVSDFEKVSNKDLLNLREKALERISAVDVYETALNGIPPETNSEILKAVSEMFIQRIQEWNKLVLYSSQPSCNRYVKNTRRLMKELQTGYSKLQSSNSFAITKGNLVLRARLEAMQFLLASQLNLADQGSEGGMSSLTEVGVKCDFSNRQLFIETNHRVKSALDALSLSYWGKRGLNNAFPVSQPLLLILSREERTQNRWAGSEYVIKSAVVLSFFSFITGRIFPEFRVFLNPKRKLLTGAGLAVAGATYGAYKGFNFAKEFAENPYIDNLWDQLQFSIEQILGLGVKNTQAYYQLISDIENSILKYNEEVVDVLTPAMKSAIERFGSLKAAQALAREKLKEINFVMKERGLHS